MLALILNRPAISCSATFRYRGRVFFATLCSLLRYACWCFQAAHLLHFRKFGHSAAAQPQALLQTFVEAISIPTHEDRPITTTRLAMNRPVHKDDDEAVLERIMADGTFDQLRHQLLDELRNDVSTLLHVNLPSGCENQEAPGVAFGLMLQKRAVPQIQNDVLRLACRRSCSNSWRTASAAAASCAAQRTMGRRRSSFSRSCGTTSISSEPRQRFVPVCPLCALAAAGRLCASL